MRSERASAQEALQCVIDSVDWREAKPGLEVIGLAYDLGPHTVTLNAT
jgi:hypothetical protein